MSDEEFSFGQFELFPGRRLLLASGQPRRLGSRAFDLLVALIGRAGEVVSKDELIAAVWPDTIVEDTSLRVHIRILRKALGEDPAAPEVITNVPRRGYCFVAPLKAWPPKKPVPSAPPPMPPQRLLPRLVGRVVGREASVEAIMKSVARHRFVTITGAGGIGKTTVALTVANAVAERFADGVVFADLTGVSEDWMVPGTLAAALGHPVSSSDLAAGLAELLHDQNLLVVLDNCEHVIAAATALAEALCEAPGVHVLATSREILRGTGEWVHRLPPLGLPPATADPPSAAEALLAPAVELFVERASASLGGYVLTDSDAPVVAEICRKLDGIALAIELAAGRVGTMGLHGLAGSLDDCLKVLTQGRRTALPRHQTLRATLDWSYRLLPTSEKAVFRRLAMFNGPFTAEAARAVAAGPDLSEGIVEECVGSLVAKSLVAADLQDGSARYRLLATSRAFARETFETEAERDRAARQHAVYFQAIFEQAEAEWETRTTAAWLAEYARHMPNLYVALEWLFACDKEESLGIALTVAALPLWIEMSQMDECLHWVSRALAVAESDPQTYRRRRMQLHAALGFPSMRVHSGLPNAAATWSTTFEIAEELGDVDYQLRALRALWVVRMNSGQPRTALELADRFCRLEAGTEAVEQRIGLRLRARSLNLLGRPAEARADVTTMLDRYVAPLLRSHVARFQFDQRVSARITLGLILWVQGRPGQALRDMGDVIADAVSSGHALSLVNALTDGACPVAFLAGDLAAAERYTALLEDNTRKRALDVWHSYAECFRGELLIRQGEPAAGVALLRQAIGVLQRSGFVLFRCMFHCALAQGLAAMDRIEEGLALLGNTLRHCEQTGEAWFSPELLRIRGRLLLLRGDATGADASYRQALLMARDQGAWSWALRTATDLARLLSTQGLEAEAVDVLAPIHGRMCNDGTTPDLGAASALLLELGQG